jgi:hypothetical protein
MPLEHHTSKTVVKGRPFPLGATPVADGVNLFDLASVLGRAEDGSFRSSGPVLYSW